jgi:simple sugar transport system ATP-binding protein
MTTSRPLLEVRGVSKRFPGVQALAGVDFCARSGEVHALMGENGAGKSTLIKVLTGVYRGDGGEILLEGNPFHPRSPLQAQQMGVSTVYQEVNLIPHLSVAENILLGRQPMRLGAIRWREVRRRAEQALAQLDLQMDVSQPLSSYSIAIQQMVAIARALAVSAKLLILDEPTSSLDSNEVARLFAVLRKLKAEGLGVLFVTHFLEQVYEISDRITVLRNGSLVGEYQTRELPRLELIAKMLGKELEAMEALPQQRESSRESAQEALVRVRGLGRKGAIAPFDLEIHSGEVVGLAGLLGSGRTEMARLLFGIDASDTGQVEVGGRGVTAMTPSRAIANGIALCPEDRKTCGIIPDLSVRENIILALQGSKGWLRAFSRKRQAQIADNYIKALNIATPDAEKAVKELSGGNQQKVILARWLAANPSLLILDEPTRGIDVGAKTEIQKLILELCQEGKAILFISSELEEVVRCSSRVAVLRDRRKIAELAGEQIDEQVIMHTIAGRQGDGEAH